MAKQRSSFVCNECGYENPKWLGRCPNCGKFNTFEEAVTQAVTANKTVSQRTVTTVTLSDIDTEGSEERIPTGIDEFDRVLSGGIVEGSLTLVGGDPGIGKSTLLLQICQNIGAMGKSVLYVSGEESARQLKMRATRLGVDTKNLKILTETRLEGIESAINSSMPQLVIVDSIQTIYRENLSNAAGSVVQVREATQAFLRISKGLGVAIIIVGHVTKDGNIAGPRVLEHMVDTVIYFEGERAEAYRLVRAVKNRFGSTNEVGVFEMSQGGLVEIKNPSQYLLSGRPKNVPGSVVTCIVEGTRPMLAEVQGLVSYSNYGVARRTATGTDYNRFVMLLAVLEKRGGLVFSNYDSYVNIAGGLKLNEPFIDAAVVLALASSHKNKPVLPDLMVFGEIGLTGELRSVPSPERRILESQKLGFKNCIVPQANLKTVKEITGINIYGASNISELLQVGFE